MAYVSPTTKTTGTLITATEWNQSVVANQQAGAPDVFTRNGDLFVGVGNDAGVCRTAGFGGQVLETYYAGTPALIWNGRVDSLTYGNLGGTGDWYRPGSDYIQSGNGLAGHFQVGCSNVIIATAGSHGTTTITFPLDFSKAPLVFATPGSSDIHMAAYPVGGTSHTQALLIASRTGTIGDGTVTVQWMAVGPFSYDGVYP
jgi:hypothetical protein